MSNGVHDGNLSFQASEDDLRALYASRGDVTDVHVMMERDTGRPRDLAFVGMALADLSCATIATLDGYEAGGRNAGVDETKIRGGRGSCHGGLRRFPLQRGGDPRACPGDPARRSRQAPSTSNPLTFAPSKEKTP